MQKQYTIEQWWNLQLCGMFHPELLASIPDYDLGYLLSSDTVPYRSHSPTLTEYTELIQAILKKKKGKITQNRCSAVTPLRKNLHKLGELLGFSSAVSDWLVFAADLHNGLANRLSRSGQNWSSCLRPNFNFGSAANASRSTQIEDKVLAAWTGLDPKGLHKLVEHGLLHRFSSPAGGRDSSLSACVTFTPHYKTLPALLDRELTKPQLVQLLLTELTPSRLSDKDFDHVDSALAVDYLRQAAKQNIKGANILVYGPPGTGKTEFVRWLSTKAGLRFFVVTPIGNESGDVLPLAQTSTTFLSHYTEGVMVVDEAEDVFVNTNYSGWLTPDKTRFSKGKLNLFLETNAAPIVWICNQRGTIDPAFRRRCDIVIEINKLPRTARLRAIRKHTHGFGILPAWKESLARNNDLTVSDIQSAARAVKLAGGRSGAQAAAAIEGVLRSKLKEREQSTAVQTKDRSVIDYRLEFVNADTDLQHIQQALQSGRTGRFCFYGPPGTGKTEFVRQTANQVDKRLIVKPASSLLGMYVGQTEKNIAQAFTEANEVDAILLIDEADSFLRNREGARQSWEVSQVNELLVQMEKFDGTLVCCSNLLDGIDPAAFRRFDLKIKFDFMRTHQVVAMLEQATGPATEDLRRRAAKLRCCTPGDFAAVLRRSEFMQQPLDAAALLKQLEHEIEFKPEGKSRAIGF